MSFSIELMPTNHLKAASQSLAEAFMSDPLQTYVFPNEEERMEKSPDHFAAILHYGLQFGEVYSSKNAEGAVVWLRPGATDVTPQKAELGGLLQLPHLLGEQATDRFLRVMDYLEPYHKDDAAVQHWYMMVVGVALAFQGTGLGKALLEPVLTKARLQHTPLYLETAEASNIPFYTKLGFKVVRKLREPVSRLTLCTFQLDHH